jgi:hypothetical protein
VIAYARKVPQAEVKRHAITSTTLNDIVQSVVDEVSNYRHGAAVVEDLLTGQYDRPLRIVVFNPVERWSRDASEVIAEELDRRISAEGREVSEALQEFVESNIGRKIGVQLALPLRI